MHVKICGITTLDDARQAATLGADLLGLNFYAQSPRYIKPEAAKALVTALRAELGEACPALVGVYVNAPVGSISIIMHTVGLDFAQLSGDESESLMNKLGGKAFKSVQPPTTAKALEEAHYFAPMFPTSERVPSLLLDAYHPALRGGTGASVGVELARAVQAVVPRLMLAGGLTPQNVAERVLEIQPWGVDVASGVEVRPGVKDASKMRDFIQAAKQAFAAS